MISRPRSSASCDASTMVTAMPALAKFMVMPPPMVPAPITAAFSIGINCVSAGTSEIFAACRSAKNKWRKALDSFDLTSLANSARSTPSALSNGRVSAALTHSTIASGAG